jgi:DNA-binding SARP family transcriptional activator
VLRLLTFGGLGLLRDGVPIRGPAAQRRRLTLLAVLAAAGRGAGVSRDKLLGYFWPEQDEESARRALNQGIYMLRRELGGRLVAGTSELALDAAVIGSDLQDFEEALNIGDVETAVELYRGPFLDGVHVDDAPDLERWVETQRSRLRLRLLRAIEESAAKAASAGNATQAARHWMRAAELEPLDGRIAVALATAMAAAGDSAGALRHADEYESRLRAELGLSPTPETASALSAFRSLRTERNATPRPARTRRDRRRTADVTVWAPSRRRWLAIASMVLAATVLSARLAWPRHGPLAPGTAGQHTVLMLPFSADSSTTRHAADEAASVVESIFRSFGSARFRVAGDTDVEAAAHSPQAAAAAAARAGADLFVVGDVQSEHGRLYVRASLRSGTNPERVLADAAAEGEAAKSHRVCIELAARLLTGVFGRQASDRLHEAAIGTGSDDAFDAFVRGEARFRETKYLDAADAFSDATRLDSTFALAWYRLAVSLDWASRPYTDVVAASNRARALDARLSPRARLLVEAHYWWRRQNPDSAEHLYRSVLEQSPDDEEARFFLAEVLFHDNPRRGRPIEEARPFLERMVADDPADYDALTHLQRLALLRGDRAGVDSIERYMMSIRGSAETEDWRYFRALAAEDPAAVDTIVRVARGQTAQWITNLGVRAFVFAEARAAAVRLISVLTEPIRSAADRATGYVHLSQMEAARGRLAASDSAARLAPRGYGIVSEVALALFPNRADSIAIRQRMLRETERARATTESDATPTALSTCPPRIVCDYLIGELALALGDTNLARQQVGHLERSAAGDHGTFAASQLAAALQSRIGDAADSPNAQGPVASAVWDIDGAQVRERFGVATEFERARQTDLALRWYDSFEAGYPTDAIYAAPGHLRRAVLLAQRADTTALVELKRARFLWRDADPELRAVLESTEDSVYALLRSGRVSGAHR